MTDINEILNERGKRYGKFLHHARLAQEIKFVFGNCGTTWSEMDDDQREALHMIAHKIARILNGDPNYPDSWVDIAGFATLVADRLEGKER